MRPPRRLPILKSLGLRKKISNVEGSTSAFCNSLFDIRHCFFQVPASDPKTPGVPVEDKVKARMGGRRTGVAFSFALRVITTGTA